MTIKNNIFLSLGIDPNPSTSEFSVFRQYLKKHMHFLDKNLPLLKKYYLKIQLAFFLRFGSNGIKLLEQFTERYQEHTSLIIDGKFNDIQNSMQGYLDFVFGRLGAHGLTINPFLGEKTITLSLEECAKHVGARGRVFVLCATSEASDSNLSYLQENWTNKLKTIARLHDQVFSTESKFKSIAGVVIGANRENILLSEELSESNLSVLVPGLGAQFDNWNLIQNCAKQKNEFIFNVGRAVFNGGAATPAQMKKNLTAVQNSFLKKS